MLQIPAQGWGEEDQLKTSHLKIVFIYVEFVSFSGMMFSFVPF